jgi:hypothetical protein
MVDNRRRSNASRLRNLSVGNPHRHVARLLLLYTTASVTVRFDASTGIEKPLSLLPTPELFASDKSKTSSSVTSLFSSSLMSSSESESPIREYYQHDPPTWAWNQSSLHRSPTIIISATRGSPSICHDNHFTSSFQHHAATTSSLAVAHAQVPLWALLSSLTTGLVNSMDDDQVQKASQHHGKAPV